MTEPQDIPEPDAVPGAPHPRMTPRLFGQDAAEAAFLGAFATGRLHHAWLISGPKGVGKATLAWRIARFLLATPPGGGDTGLFGATPAPDSLAIPDDHPVARRVRALSEPRLLLLRRGWDDKSKRLRTEITVDEARRLGPFFGLSVPDGGRRVVIVDAADEMNVNAANALLKVLEEPPADATLLLVCHRPARLLPTIRSRCRELKCAPLSADSLARAIEAAGAAPGTATGALAELAGGSAGAALTLAEEGGPALYARIVALFDKAPGLDRAAAIALAEIAGGGRAGEARRDMLVGLIQTFLARLARAGAGVPPAQEAASGEATTLARLSPDARAARAWADQAETLAARIGHGLGVNLDPPSLILDTVLKINERAAEIVSRH